MNIKGLEKRLDQLSDFHNRRLFVFSREGNDCEFQAAAIDKGYEINSQDMVISIRQFGQEPSDELLLLSINNGEATRSIITKEQRDASVRAAKQVFREEVFEEIERGKHRGYAKVA